MLELEVVVVLVGLRSESYFLHLDLGLLGFQFLLAFLLLVEKLRVTDEPANGRLGIGRNLNEVNTLLACHVKRLTRGYYHRLDVVAHDAHFAHADLLVDAVLLLVAVVSRFLRLRHTLILKPPWRGTLYIILCSPCGGGKVIFFVNKMSASHKYLL